MGGGYSVDSLSYNRSLPILPGMADSTYMQLPLKQPVFDTTNTAPIDIYEADKQNNKETKTTSSSSSSSTSTDADKKINIAGVELTPAEARALRKAYDKMLTEKDSIEQDAKVQAGTVGSIYALNAGSAAVTAGWNKYRGNRVSPTSSVAVQQELPFNAAPQSTPSQPVAVQQELPFNATPQSTPSQPVAVQQELPFQQETTASTPETAKPKKSRFKKFRQRTRIARKKTGRAVAKPFKAVSNVNKSYTAMTAAASEGGSHSMTYRNWRFKSVTKTYQFVGSSSTAATGAAANTATVAAVTPTVANAGAVAAQAENAVKAGKTATNIINGCGKLTKGVAGSAGVFTGIATATEDIGDITYAYKYGEKGDCVKQVAQTTTKSVSSGLGAWAGAKAGLALGAKIGTAIGAWFGGVGAPIGAAIGGLLGSAIGAIAGGWAAKRAAQAAVGKDVGERLAEEHLKQQAEEQAVIQAQQEAIIQLQSYNGLDVLSEKDSDLKSALEKIQAAQAQGG